MKLLGPLNQFSCMRFEAKHKEMKEFVTKRNNYKNVPHTIAINHQLKLSSVMTEKDLYSREIETERLSKVDASVLCQEFSHCPVVSAKTLYKCKKAKVDGITYSIDCILCVSVSTEGLPEFVNVEDLFIDTDVGLIFAGRVLETIGFAEHLHAWNVSELPRRCVCLQKDLVYPHPLHINSPIFGDYSKYVSPKLYLETTS